MTVWIYVDTSKAVGHPEHLKVFADEAVADEWFKDNDPEGVAFEYDVSGSPPGWVTRLTRRLKRKSPAVRPS
jgi:hypothetical protein